MGLSRSVEIPLQTSGKWGLGAWIQAAEHPAPAGAGGGTGPLPAAGPFRALRPAQPAALWKPEMVPFCPPPLSRLGSAPSGAVGHRRVQRQTRCDTHSFNCTYTKEGKRGY